MNSVIDFAIAFCLDIAVIVIIYLMISFIISKYFYEYKLYVFNELKKALYKIMKHNIGKEKKVKITFYDITKATNSIEGVFGKEFEMENAFNNFWKSPEKFALLLALGQKTIRVSRNFLLCKTTTPNYIQRTEYSNEDTFLKRTNVYPWARPFKKWIKFIHTRNHLYYQSYRDFESYLNQKAVFPIRFKIFLDFLTWFFKKKNVILH